MNYKIEAVFTPHKDNGQVIELSDNKVYNLLRNNIFLICPDSSHYCFSRCPFFELSDDKTKVSLSCRWRTMTIILDEKGK